MTLSEARVVHEEHASVLHALNGGIMPLRDFDIVEVVGAAAPENRRGEPYAGATKLVVGNLAGADRRIAVLVRVRSEQRLRTEHADLVSAGAAKPAVRHEQIPPSVGAKEVCAFAGIPVSSGNLHAVIRIGGVLDERITHGMVAQAGFRIELEHPDAAEPGAERHPHFTVFAEHGRRVDGVDPGVFERKIPRHIVIGRFP